MQDIKLTRTNTKAFAYNTKSAVEFWGKFEAVIETRKRIYVATFYVAKAANCGNLLSLSTAQELGLISLHLDKLTSKDAALENILQKHSKVFSGLYRYKRLNYGTNAAAEIFQYTLQTALQGLKGVKNIIADDIIVFGSTRTEHDANLDKCLQRLAMKGLRLNRSKCNFLSTTLSFFGQVFSKEGTHPDPIGE
ncbi:Hypothetical predicted protein [Paramuricea clavata]|uniref:Reverse transcriptase domain-containing protein n=1 Tax=Paramuricea clavata TaxID=317549 RepID=A0A7D9IIY9_PARCT|nr:Hypothetical predicted protein [Paramuricea clavata]